MSVFGAMDISASGLVAERLRMDTIAANLANASSTRSENGGPYRRREVVLREGGGTAGVGGASLATFGEFDGNLKAASGAGVKVAGIQEDPSPFREVYDPAHPDADARGIVQLPNVNPVTEMVDLISATRAYEANTTALNAMKQEFMRALDVLR
jgi:flagellar basal-body rod protein FlgC